MECACVWWYVLFFLSLFAAACCGCNPAAAAASTVFFSLWIAAAAVQTAATVSACSQPNTPLLFFLFSLVRLFILVPFLLFFIVEFGWTK
jgi:hypothetical protein